MKFYKTISVILHPIVVPTIGVILYFILIPSSLAKQQRLALLSLIFVTTYIIPLVVLILFKKFKLIKSFNTNSIKERKIPVAMMIVLYYLLGNTLSEITNLSDLGLLFYAACGALILVYFLFAFNLKTSIHLLSLGLASGFFIVLGIIYSKAFIATTIVILLLAGLLASARLHLKAHTQKEVYLGYFIGFIAPFVAYYIL